MIKGWDIVVRFFFFFFFSFSFSFSFSFFLTFFSLSGEDNENGRGVCSEGAFEVWVWEEGGEGDSGGGKSLFCDGT